MPRFSPDVEGRSRYFQFALGVLVCCNQPVNSLAADLVRHQQQTGRLLPGGNIKQRAQRVRVL